MCVIDEKLSSLKELIGKLFVQRREALDLMDTVFAAYRDPVARVWCGTLKGALTRMEEVIGGKLDALSSKSPLDTGERRLEVARLRSLLNAVDSITDSLMESCAGPEFRANAESALRRLPSGTGDRHGSVQVLVGPSSPLEDGAPVSADGLHDSACRHKGDVAAMMHLMSSLLLKRGMDHDWTKLKFFSEFLGQVRSVQAGGSWDDADGWFRRHHLEGERYELDAAVPDDVDLLDVLEYLADRVVSDVSGALKCPRVELAPELLERALRNTESRLRQSAQREGAGE